MENDPIIIVAATRTPAGNLLGQFNTISATELGRFAIEGLLEKANIDPNKIDAIIMGNVLSAGLGQAPARQAALKAKLPESICATTINKMCGSGMQAMIMAHDALLAGSHQIMIAGGMESMTNAPYLIPKARQGYRFGHAEIKDHMVLDGLEDAYDTGTAMGCFADETAKKYNITREEQDEFAIHSLKRAHEAQEKNLFAEEITSVTVKNKKNDITIDKDELPDLNKLEKIPTLKPAFTKDGTVTAANASSISDGASAILMMRESLANKLNLKPLAKIVGHATHAQAPQWFTTAPIGAIQKLCKKTNWNLNDVDLFEINEAFAIVTLATIKELNLPAEKVNIHGGACALGHPIGASGARITTTLLHALKQKGLKRGIASLCIGGGEATAIAIELY